MVGTYSIDSMFHLFIAVSRAVMEGMRCDETPSFQLPISNESLKVMIHWS